MSYTGIVSTRSCNLDVVNGKWHGVYSLTCGKFCICNEFRPFLHLNVGSITSTCFMDMGRFSGIFFVFIIHI